MAIKQKLEHSQKFVFSQSLRQAIKILELPILELRDMVEAQIEENPAIEETLDPSQGPMPKTAKEEKDEDEPYDLSEKTAPTDEPEPYERPVAGQSESLHDVLLRQLRINAENDTQVSIGTHIILNIDENGYLRPDDEVMAPLAGYDPQDIASTLVLIQTFDPAGVCARNLKECLLLQMDRRNDPDPVTRRLIVDFLEEVASPDTARLTRKCRCSPEELTSALHKIHSLEPKPGRAFTQENTAYVIPDVTIEEKDGRLSVAVENTTLPVIRVNPTYRRMLRAKNVDETTKDFIREKIKNATNLLNAIQGRRQTMAKVVGLVADIQQAAMLEGLEKLRPLTLKELAERTGLHESTVSRIIMHKHVQTPIGIYALKDFFSTGLKNTDGGNIAAQTIRLKIRELIENEDKAHPLRDQTIARIIAETEKITLARRTVAKYREHLKIPPVSQRRRTTPA